MVNHMVHPSPMELPNLMVHPLPMVLLLTDNHTVLLSPMVPLSHTVLQHLTDNSHIELLSHMETPTSH